MTNQMKQKSNPPNLDLRFLLAAFRPFKEVYLGIKSRTIYYPFCIGWSLVFTSLFTFEVDAWFMEKMGWDFLYPYNYPTIYYILVFMVTNGGFFLWGCYQAYLRQKLKNQLEKAFEVSLLKNKLGKHPALVCDEKVDDFTRKLTLRANGIPKSTFISKKDHLEVALQVYIDEISEKIEEGKIMISYSHYPMPNLVKVDSLKTYPQYQFVVGRTRGSQIVKSLKDVPHLLVAGQTGGGKSTFLRQLITTLHVNNKQCNFTLVDLKGGLEFQTFENRERIEVLPNLEEAVTKFGSIGDELKRRMRLLKNNKVKDVDAYNKKTNSDLGRHVIVIDEAAEMFLVGQGTDATKIHTARSIISRVARQGRAVGIHLVVATQRPDARSLDSQVKANLVGVICFQMLNDASSISVIGCGRATDLPAIAGRAIWKEAMDMVEVQTPLLEPSEAEELIGPEKEPQKSEEVEAAKVENKQKVNEALATPGLKKTPSKSKNGLER